MRQSPVEQLEVCILPICHSFCMSDPAPEDCHLGSVSPSYYDREYTRLHGLLCCLFPFLLYFGHILNYNDFY